jgi:hypothetical protein
VAATLIVPVVDEGLGSSANLVDLRDGRALAVDVPRDLRAAPAATESLARSQLGWLIPDPATPLWADATGRTLEVTA